MFKEISTWAVLAASAVFVLVFQIDWTQNISGLLVAVVEGGLLGCCIVAMFVLRKYGRVIRRGKRR